MELLIGSLFYFLIGRFVYKKIKNKYEKNINYKQKSFSESEHEHHLFKKLDEAVQAKNTKPENTSLTSNLYKPEHPIFKDVHPIVTSKPYEGYLPYVRRYCLMSNAELSFFKILQQIVKEKYYIVPQVQLSKLIEVEAHKKWEYTHLNKIDRKSVDFVLFDKNNFTPHLVIELDDSSHLRKDRQTRDRFLNAVLNKAGIKIVHIQNAYRYPIDEITKLIS